MKLQPQLVEKPWGRADLRAPFAGAPGAKVGELWFEPTEASAKLLLKYIFTSERLSVQVHPDDAQAHARGLPNGKTECWFIVDAEPGAEIGIGLTRRVEAAALRDAALDGSIVGLLDWQPVTAGDFLYVPAGTVHAIGAGITLVEVQQNSDTTYRLYDYGRPRELHLDDGIAVALPAPYPPENRRRGNAPGVLIETAAFGIYLADTTGEIPVTRDRWLVPLKGSVSAGADRAGVGECLFVGAGEPFEIDDDTRLLVAIA